MTSTALARWERDTKRSSRRAMQTSIIRKPYLQATHARSRCWQSSRFSEGINSTSSGAEVGPRFFFDHPFRVLEGLPSGELLSCCGRELILVFKRRSVESITAAEIFSSVPIVGAAD